MIIIFFLLSYILPLTLENFFIDWPEVLSCVLEMIASHPEVSYFDSISLIYF